MDIGEKMRLLREARGFSRIDLARKVGITVGSLRKIEEAEVRGPSFSNGVLIAQALRAWPDELTSQEPFPPDLTFTRGGVLVEVRLRIRGNEGTRNAIIRTLRRLLGERIDEPIDGRLDELEAQLTDLHRGTAEVLAEIVRLKQS